MNLRRRKVLQRGAPEQAPPQRLPPRAVSGQPHAPLACLLATGRLLDAACRASFRPSLGMIEA